MSSTDRIAQQVAATSTSELEEILFSEDATEIYTLQVLIMMADELEARLYGEFLTALEEEEDENIWGQDYDYDYSQDEDYFSFREEDFWDEPFTDWS